MRFAIIVLCWILGLAAIDTFAFAAQVPYPDPVTWTPPAACPGGTICPAPAAAPAVYGDHRRPVVRATGRVMRGGGRVLRGAGRVLAFPFRVFGGCRGRCG